jgi:hypothetical protein
MGFSLKVLRDYTIQLEGRLLQVFHRESSGFDSRPVYVGFMYGNKSGTLVFFSADTLVFPCHFRQ